MKNNFCILMVLLIGLCACSEERQMEFNSGKSDRKNIDPELYQKFIQDKKFLKICQNYSLQKGLLTKAVSADDHLMEQYAREQDCDNVEDYIMQYYVDDIAGLGGLLNSVISEADLTEWRFLRMYELASVNMTIEKLQAKIYNCINSNEGKAAEVYRDLQIKKRIIRNYKLPLSDEGACNYLQQFGIPRDICKPVVWAIMSAYREIEQIIEKEVQEKSSTETPNRPNRPGSSVSIYNYTLEEILNNAAIERVPLEELGEVRGHYSVHEAIEYISTSCISSRERRFYIYRDWAGLDSKEAKAFRVSMKIDYNKGNNSLLEVVVSDGYSYTMYLLLIDNFLPVITDCIEVGRWYIGPDQAFYMTKEWVINEKQELIVGEFRTEAVEKFEDSFVTINANKVLSKYKITAGKLGFVKEQSFGTYILTPEYFDSFDKIAENF